MLGKKKNSVKGDLSVLPKEKSRLRLLRKKFKKPFKLSSVRYFLIVVPIIAVGVYFLFFAHAATAGMGTDCTGPNTETVNKQQLICDTHAQHEGGPFPYIPNGHGQQYTPTYSYAAGNQYGPPPANGINVLDNGWPAGYMPDSIHAWLELTSDSTTNVNANVEIRKGSMNIALHTTNNGWKVGTADGTGGFAWQFYTWGNDRGHVAHVDASTNQGIAGNPMLGWNVPHDDAGYPNEPRDGAFMGVLNNGDGSPSRIKDHGGPWNQVAPGTDLSKVDAVVAWGTFRVIGPQKDQAQYRLELGVDRANLRALSEGYGWPSFAGRLRKVTPQWQTFTVNTMNDSMMNTPGYADALAGIIPGYDATGTGVNNPSVTVNVSSSSGMAPATVTVTATSSLAATINITQNGNSTVLKSCTNSTTCSYSASYASAGTYSFNATATTTSGGSGSGSGSITLQGPVVPLANGTYNDDDPSITYSGSWTADSSGTTEHYSNTPTASTVSFNFKGEQLTLVSHGNYDMGRAIITIDGAVQTTSNIAEWYSPTYVQPKTNWVSAKFDKTTSHSVVITVSPSKNPLNTTADQYVSIDQIVIADAPVTTGKPGDTNGDTKVDITDLTNLAVNFGQSGKTLAQGDLDGNGIVNIADLTILVSNWGK